MVSEGTFWRTVAGTLGLLLAICVVANSVREETVPRQIAFLLFGALVALGVGNAIVNPGTSLASLAEHEEARFRRRQYIAGFFLSAILVLLMALTELRGSALAWLFAPIIVLPFVLVIRERIKRS